MFATYKRVFWLSALMSVFVFAPFYVTGFSTDVWTHLIRIREWVAAGFPWREQLLMSYNFPFGDEMHWTRPLDIIGYIFAWPFIPGWGLKRALEIMAAFTPILFLIVGVRGFFFGLRGYLTPRMAFLAFWLFFWGIGYGWGQSLPGYFDQHVFHFALLLWCIGLILRSFRVKENAGCLVWSGILGAIGTWITADFFVNLYILSLPFALGWLIRNMSLKPLLLFFGSYTLVLGGVMLFDHPIGGFFSLDLYRPSLIHVIIGAMTCLAVGVLMFLFRYVRSTCFRRLIYGTLICLSVGLFLILVFGDVFMRPPYDLWMYHTWVKHVSEMQPLWSSWNELLEYTILPFILAIGMMVWVIRRYRSPLMPLVVIGAAGTIIYACVMAFHVRVGISQMAFFVYLGAAFLNLVFFPREKSFKISFLFVVFYLIFMGTHLKGNEILTRIKTWGVQHYLEMYKKDNTIDVPEYLKPLFENAVREEMKNNRSETAEKPKEEVPEKQDFKCVSNEKIWDVIRQDASNGALFTDIFSAPQLVWETGKPTLGGPYHTNVAGITDLFSIQTDRPPYHRARALLKKHQVTQLYLFHPSCQSVLFEKNGGKTEPYTKNMFHFAVYHETEDMPDWVRLEYEDPATHIKIFRVEPVK